MGNIAVKVENLGKMYRIGGPQESYKTFRDAITKAASAPFKRARDLMRGQAYGAAGLTEEIWALKDVSFEVKHGEVVGIIGRNGAGKSTLLKILSRITEPTTGYADVYGRVGALLEVGTGFHPELTGRENVYLNGAILGMSRNDINRKFDEIVDFAGVEKFIDTPVKHYSSGMGLRLGFSVAAHLEPEILVVDEVLAVGDAEFQKKCLGKMSDVAGEGRTVLLVSHNMAAIRNLCQRSVVLNNGIVTFEGLTESAVSHYLESLSGEVESEVRFLDSDLNLPAHLLSVAFRNYEGIAASEFRMGESWQITAIVKINRPISHFIVGMGIGSIEHGSIMTIWSEARDVIPGYYQVTYDIDAPLSASRLQFEIGLSSHEITFKSYKNVGYVTILDVAVADQPLRAKVGVIFNAHRPPIRQIEPISPIEELKS